VIVVRGGNDIWVERVLRQVIAPHLGHADLHIYNDITDAFPPPFYNDNPFHQTLPDLKKLTMSRPETWTALSVLRSFIHAPIEELSLKEALHDRPLIGLEFAVGLVGILSMFRPLQLSLEFPTYELLLFILGGVNLHGAEAISLKSRIGRELVSQGPLNTPFETPALVELDLTGFMVYEVMHFLFHLEANRLHTLNIDAITPKEELDALPVDYTPPVPTTLPSLGSLSSVRILRCSLALHHVLPMRQLWNSLHNVEELIIQIWLYEREVSLTTAHWADLLRVAFGPVDGNLPMPHLVRLQGRIQSSASTLSLLQVALPEFLALRAKAGGALLELTSFYETCSDESMFARSWVLDFCAEEGHSASAK
jgi:hypothetical protein